MTSCPQCRQPVVQAKHSTRGILLLEPGGTLDVFTVAADTPNVYPQAHAKPEEAEQVFLSTGTIEHRHVCLATWRERIERMNKLGQAKKERASGLVPR